MMLSKTGVATRPYLNMRSLEVILPSLKTGLSVDPPHRTMKRIMSIESDFAREQDDLLYLQLGQGANYTSSKRGHLSFSDAFSSNGDRADITSVAESDCDTEPSSTTTKRRRKSARSSRSTRSRVFSPPLSPPVEDPMGYDVPLEERPSQRDVYDVAPPPGYKRLKKVRSSRKRDVTDPTVSSVQQSAYVDYSPYAADTSRQSSHPPHHQLFQQLPVQFLGDGFSGDETKTRRSKKRVKTDNSSNSAGSSSRRKKAKAEASPILGSLDIVTLSQEERAVDMAAAAAAAYASARAASRIQDVTTVIPLRPVHRAPPAVSWEFDNEFPPMPEDTNSKRTEETENTKETSQGGRRGCGEVRQADADEALATISCLPALRHVRV